MIAAKPTYIKDDKSASALRKNKHVTYVDAFSRQLEELFFIENNSFIGSDKKKTFAGADFKAYAKKKSGAYAHVFYPWNNTLVKTVKKDDYLTLKTNRNRDLIAKDEQALLSKARVAVFGMSVGSNIAFVLTQAGISNDITIADFDELDTTNLNRILAGAHQIGLNKTVVAARRIYEDNPFAKVRTLPKGINSKTLEALLKAKKLDIIVEEVDNIQIKIEVRILALKYRIPIVMVTDNGDGVVLHVERYDLGLKTIWGKDPSYFMQKIANGPMSREESGKTIMFDIVGGPQHVDPKMIESVKKVVAKELVSWSQLGSAAILGGVIVTYFLKRILLRQDKRLDVRAYIHPEHMSYSSHS